MKIHSFNTTCEGSNWPNDLKDIRLEIHLEVAEAQALALLPVLSERLLQQIESIGQLYSSQPNGNPSSDPSLSITATDGVLCSESLSDLSVLSSLTVTETQQLADLIARLSSLDRSLVASILSNSEAPANA